MEVSYTVKNTTKGFAPVRINATLNADQTAQDAYLSIDSGSSCWETSGQLMVSSDSPIGYGGVLRGDYFIIVPNYYSPAQPRGNATFAKKACTCPSVYYGSPGTSSCFILLQYHRGSTPRRSIEAVSAAELVAGLVRFAYALCDCQATPGSSS